MKIVVSRPVRRRYKEDGKVKTNTEYVDIEFIMPKEYEKILDPVFSDLYYDYKLKEENGIITFVLTPRPDINPNCEMKTPAQKAA